MKFNFDVGPTDNPNIKERPLGLMKIFKLQRFAVLCIDYVFSHLEFINVYVLHYFLKTVALECDIISCSLQCL